LKLLNKQQKPNGCQELEDEDTRNQRDWVLTWIVWFFVDQLQTV
jgi:hypothetical protein